MGVDFMLFIYFSIAICATILGSLAGLGGGIIIKPILDTIGNYNLSTVGILSSVTVFSMALVSTIEHFKSGFKINCSIGILSIASILGGGVGEKLFNLFLLFFKNQNVGKGIQALILISLLIFVLFKNKLPKYNIKNKSFIFIVGFFLGVIASFLCIGGGPINVAILIMFFNFSTKNAAVSSVFIILLSQFSKLFLISIESGFLSFDLSVLPVMIIGGVLGGLLGAKLNQKLSNIYIDKIFNISVICVILISIFNVYTAFKK